MSYASVVVETNRPPAVPNGFPAPASSQAPSLPAVVRDLPLRRRPVRSREHVFRAGQPRRALYLIHAGTFKTTILSDDGREKITGFRLRGDLLGLDALDMTRYACDAVALDVGEVWELPCEELAQRLPAFQYALTAALAAEIRRDWHWMLTVATLTAEQRVVTFLLDLGSRLGVLGFSARRMTMRMTRAELGNFLGLKLETVVRALSRLQALGLIRIEGHEIRILEANGLSAVLTGGADVSDVPPRRLAA
jgi:CRP/FNR family transcriptional regulator, anaerobic regulatory protein